MITISKATFAESMLRAQRTFTVFLAAVALLTSLSCNKPASQPPASVAPSDTPSSTGAVDTEPQASTEPETRFADPKQQERFDYYRNVAAVLFAPPAPGIPVRVVRTTTGRIDGDFLRITSNGVALSTSDGPVIVRKSNLDEQSQSMLFADAFTRRVATQLLTLENERKRPVEFIETFFDPNQPVVRDTRKMIAEHMDVRYGPGLYYATNGMTLFRGQNVFVAFETNGWICVQETDVARRMLGWIPKFSSFMMHADKPDRVADEVEHLIADGFLIDVIPEKNQALVDRFEWHMTDTYTREGKCRILAIYCGQKKNSRLYWVMIKDALDGKQIAEYSVSKGLKLF